MRTVPKPKREPSISSLKEKARHVFSRYIRMRDGLETTGSMEYSECFTCDNSLPIQELHAGHYIHNKNAVFFHEKNVHAQCRACNYYRNGEPEKYKAHLIEKYGPGIITELEELSHPIKRWKRHELESLLGYYKEKIKKMEGV